MVRKGTEEQKRDKMRAPVLAEKSSSKHPRELRNGSKREKERIKEGRKRVHEWLERVAGEHKKRQKGVGTRENSKDLKGG